MRTVYLTLMLSLHISLNVHTILTPGLCFYLCLSLIEGFWAHLTFSFVSVWPFCLYVTKTCVDTVSQFVWNGDRWRWDEVWERARTPDICVCVCVCEAPGMVAVSRSLMSVYSCVEHSSWAIKAEQGVWPSLSCPWRKKVKGGRESDGVEWRRRRGGNFTSSFLKKRKLSGMPPTLQ